MSTTTSNLGLIKPEKSDNYNVDVMCENMDIIDGKLKEHETELATCIKELTIPIKAKLSTTNQGYGWIAHSNGAYTSPVGFEFSNPDDTYTVSFSNYAQFSLTVYPSKINLLTGEVTDLGAVSVKQGNTGSKTYTLKMIEAFICYNSSSNSNLTVTRPTIYINAL